MRNAKFTLILYAAALIGTVHTPPVLAKDVTEEVSPPVVSMVPATFADIAEKLTPAVVNISSTQKAVVPEDYPQMPQFPEGSPFEEFFEEFMQRRGGGMAMPPAASLGSGFIVDAQNGYIVTNNHVVRDADDVQITLYNDVTISAEIIGTDDKTDIAVLKVNPEGLDLKSVSFGDSDILRVGDWTLAIGNPFGLGGSVTAGIVSARARDINSGPYDDYIQTDASINRGNSGGPLFNMKGEVIGINTAIFSPTGGSVGIGFSIPSALANPVVNQIIKYGRTRRGWLGVRIQTVTDEIAESLGLDKARGALVASITEDGPADKAGLQAGDIILELNQQEIREMKYLPRIVAENDVGTQANVKFWRDGKMGSATVTIGELEKAEEEGLVSDDAVLSQRGVEATSVGLVMLSLDDTLREQFNIPATTKGIVITDVLPNSEALKKGLVKGNVIVEINQQAVSEPQDVVDVIEKAQKNGKSSVLLLIESNGAKAFVALRLP